VRFTETLPGAWLIEPEPIEDRRGLFARVWDREAFSERGLDPAVAQCNISYNARRGTLRGLHMQRPPNEEVKLIRCTRGSLYDVIVDMRPDSSTYLLWFGVTLDVVGRAALYVPHGFAHGFETLEDDTETFYMVSEPYTPGAEAGVRWDDPAVGIRWPVIPLTEISDKDAGWPLLERVTGPPPHERRAEPRR
jgi:dTDP-4-dehydrorhamnose 3,5-epimerase